MSKLLGRWWIIGKDRNWHLTSIYNNGVAKQEDGTSYTLSDERLKVYKALASK